MRSCQAGLPDAAEGAKLAVFVYVDDERRVKITSLEAQRLVGLKSLNRTIGLKNQNRAPAVTGAPGVWGRQNPREQIGRAHV